MNGHEGSNSYYHFDFIRVCIFQEKELGRVHNIFTGQNKRKGDSVTRNMYHYSVKKESVTGELVIKSTETKFSAPDSSGNQHIISRTETESVYKETSDAKTDVYNEDRMQSGSRIRDSTHQNIVYSKEVEKETKRPAALTWVIIYSVIASLAYIIYRFILKK